jgi:hypothetical protein
MLKVTIGGEIRHNPVQDGPNGHYHIKQGDGKREMHGERIG